MSRRSCVAADISRVCRKSAPATYPLRPFIRDSRPIRNLESACAFIYALVDADCMYHLEDSPLNILRGQTGETLFSPGEARIVARRIAECYALRWGGHEDWSCPIDYMMYAEQKVAHQRMSKAEMRVKFDNFTPMNLDTSTGRYELICVLEWNDSNGDFIQCTDKQLLAILEDARELNNAKRK